MKEISFLQNIFSRNSGLKSSFNFDFPTEENNKVYLKEMALETCINFIARTFAQSEFMVMDNKKRVKSDWDYILNVRPNTDQSSADFWQRFIHTLISQNEVLVVKTDTNDLLIADSFYREEFAIYPDRFSNVIVKDYEFKRTFEMGEVIYLTYNNERLERYLNGLMNDYGDLYTRMIESSKRAYQIRAKVSIGTSVSLDDAVQNPLQTFIDKLFKSIKTNTVALLPIQRGFEYDEVSSGDGKGASIEDINKLKRSITDDVAEILGIPTALIHGEIADLSNSLKAYVKLTLNPLIKKVNDELKAKIISKSDYQKGKTILVNGMRTQDIFELAVQVEKLVGSGVFSSNDVREKLGEERVNNPKMDEYVITKNFESVNASKGGENTNEQD